MGFSARGLAAATAAIFCLALATASPSFAGELVVFKNNYPAGTIVVRTTERRLYLVLGEGKAIRYTVGVGRAGLQWTGTTVIESKHLRPSWWPPANIRRDRPNLPSMIPGGAPNNPIGAAALSLLGGKYAIHGTNNPGSIGGFVSYGCIRMTNEDILDLYARVHTGTRVVVLR